MPGLLLGPHRVSPCLENSERVKRPGSEWRATGGRHRAPDFLTIQPGEPDGEPGFFYISYVHVAGTGPAIVNGVSNY